MAKSGMLNKPAHQAEIVLIVFHCTFCRWFYANRLLSEYRLFIRIEKVAKEGEEGIQFVLCQLLSLNF